MTHHLAPTVSSSTRRSRLLGATLAVASLAVLALVVCWLRPTGGPLQGERLYVVPDSQAAISAKTLAESGDVADAKLMGNLAAQPSAVWLNGGKPAEVQTHVQQVAEAAAAAGEVPTFVVYNLPRRDCKTADPAARFTDDDYRVWVLGIYRGLDMSDVHVPGSSAPLYPDFKAVLIYEPDSVAQTVGEKACLQGDVASQRWALEAETIRKFKTLPGMLVYLDAGNAGWFSDPSVMVEPLKAAGADLADGLAINVSNFQTSADSVKYGHILSAALDGKHFVIDTSRNGSGPYVNSVDPVTDPTWCNPPEISAGPLPTVDTGETGVDAYLWVKLLGESDGSCRPGEPLAGIFMPDKALAALRPAA